MKILDFKSFLGPNVYASRPAAVLTLDFGKLADWTVARLQTDRKAEVRRSLPAMALAENMPLPDAYAQIVSALLRAAGCAHVAATAEALGVGNLFLVVAEQEMAPVATEAARLAAALSDWMARDDARAAQRIDEPVRAIGQFLEWASSMPDQTTRALVREAERRGIPCMCFDDHERQIQLGQGVHQVSIIETVSSRTSMLGTQIARSKSRTQRLLAQLALPTTRQFVVRTEDEAIRAAETVGYPVVVKPENCGKSIAVSVGLTSRESVVTAFRRAKNESWAVLVENLVRGDDHRLLVVDGKLVAAARRVPAHVVGDGRRTVGALVEELNRDPRRGGPFTNLLVRVDLDDEAERMLALAGLSVTSVPADGQRVVLRGASNVHAGGTAVDVTRSVHPDNRIAVERAARAAGLDIVGVDFVMPDIARSWREVGGAIIEINQSPGLRPHWCDETSPDVTAAIVDNLMPSLQTGRIPIAAVTGTNGKTTTTMLTAHIMALDGRVVGSATTYGVRVGSENVARGDFAGASGGSILLRDPRVDAAVLECARRGLIRHGLAFDWCDVGAVLNIGSDHVGTEGVETQEDLAQVKRLVVAHAKRLAVLNADDDLCAALAEGLEAPVCWVSFSQENPLVRAHVDAGFLAVWLDDSDPSIVIYDGSKAHTLIAIKDIPITMSGAARHNVQNAMFAAAIAFGLGEDLDKIRNGLRTFVSDAESNPGRSNFYDALPFDVIVEYAHNAEALEAAAQFSRRRNVVGQRIAVLWSNGNRVDSHYAALSRAAAAGFDRFICTEPLDKRGRAPGDISERLARGLREAGVAEDRIDVRNNDEEAVAHALAMARPGDFLTICCNDFERTWRQVASFRPLSG